MVETLQKVMMMFCAFEDCPGYSLTFMYIEMRPFFIELSHLFGHSLRNTELLTRNLQHPVTTVTTTTTGSGLASMINFAL